MPSLPIVESSALLRALDTGYLVQDVRGALLDADPRTRQLLGQDISGTDPFEGCVDGSGLPLVPDRRPAALALRSAGPVRGQSVGVPDRSGGAAAFRWFRVDSAVLDRDVDGAPVSVVCLLTSVAPEEIGTAMTVHPGDATMSTPRSGASAPSDRDYPGVPVPRAASPTQENWVGYGQSWTNDAEQEQASGRPGAVPGSGSRSEPASRPESVSGAVSGATSVSGPVSASRSGTGSGTSAAPDHHTPPMQFLGRPGEVTGKLDADGRFIDIGGPVRDLFGLTGEELIGRSFASLVHAETTDRLHAALAAAWIADGGRARVRCRRSDGELRWVELNVHREPKDEPDAPGEPELRIVIQDVHQQVSAVPRPEAGSGQSTGEQLIMMSIHDRNGMFRYASPTASRLLGHRSESLVGRELSELIHPQDHDALMKAREQASRGNTATVDLRMLRADSSWQLVTADMKPVLDVDGSVLELQMSTTLRKEEIPEPGPMRRSTDIVYSKALECLECGVAQLSPDGRFLRLNDKMVEVLGRQRMQAEGKSLELFLSPSDRGLSTRLRRELVRGYQERLRTAVTVQRGDGSTVPGTIELTPVRDDAGVVHGVIAKFRRNTCAPEADVPRTHDRLTAAGTPVLLRERVDELLAQGRRVALLEISVDGMRRINEERGRNAGDQILVTLVQRLRAGTRTGDTVIRLGEDRFVALCPDVDTDQVEPVAQRLCRSLAAPVEGIGSVTVSVGGSTWRAGDTLETLLQRVAGQVEAVKRAGGAGWALV